MRTSPKAMAIFYFLVSALFLYMAASNATETIWNSFTIIFTAVAALDLIVGIRFLKIHMQIKRHHKRK